MNICWNRNTYISVYLLFAMKKTFNIFMALLFQNGWLVHFSFNNTVKIRSKQLCHCLQCSLKQQCVLMANTRWQPRQTSIPLVSAQMVVIIVSLHSWLLGVWFNAFNLHRGRSLFTTDRSTQSLSKGNVFTLKPPAVEFHILKPTTLGLRGVLLPSDSVLMSALLEALCGRPLWVQT